MIESRDTIKVKTHNYGTDAKWHSPIALCVALLLTGNVAGEPMRLGPP